MFRNGRLIVCEVAVGIATFLVFLGALPSTFKSAATSGRRAFVSINLQQAAAEIGDHCAHCSHARNDACVQNWIKAAKAPLIIPNANNPLEIRREWLVQLEAVDKLINAINAYHCRCGGFPLSPTAVKIADRMPQVLADYR